MEGQPLKQEMSTDKATGAQKAVSEDRYDLIPPKALEYLARVYGKGSRKYADRNWEKGYSWGKSFRALISHAYKAWRGEWYDNHSGDCPPQCLDHTELPHLAQVAWHCFALLTYYDNKLGTDDRSKVGVPITATEIQQRRAEANRQDAVSMLDWAKKMEKDLEEENRRRKLKDLQMLPGPITEDKKLPFISLEDMKQMLPKRNTRPFTFVDDEGNPGVARSLFDKTIGFCPECREQVAAGTPADDVACGKNFSS